MARSGRIPDERSIHRNPTVEWMVVDDVPFDFRAAGRSLPPTRTWHDDTQRWFDVVAGLPHAARWDDGDWLAVTDLAMLKNKFYAGAASSSEVTEIRQRENDIGVTAEARIKNRVRYEPVASAPETAVEPSVGDATGTDGASVTAIASVRDRLRQGR